MKIKSYIIAPLISISKIIFALLLFLTDRLHFNFLKRNKLLLGAFIISLAASISGCHRHHVPHGTCYKPVNPNSELFKKISSEKEKPDKV
jgi:hypothetical protein